MLSDHDRPDLCSAGHVLVVTVYPPSTGGTSVIMSNLLSCFNPRSFSIVTTGSSRKRNLEFRHDVEVHSVIAGLKYSTRLNWWWQHFRLPSATRQTIALVKELKPAVIVGVHPFYHTLKMARDAAAASGTPWIAYLHDTLAEALSDGPMEERALELQNQVFSEASSIFVMSEGMADLYDAKYGLRCSALEHSYPETIPAGLPDSDSVKQAFWGGNVYEINSHALGRVSRALRTIDVPLQLAGEIAPKTLTDFGIAGDHIHSTFFPQRASYLENLEKQGLLILALNWPDECDVHEDELRTIFPTKTPEYLASGRPILVHCPEHYFLARFFRERNCGLVVSERSEETLAKACEFLLSEAPTVVNMRESGLQAARHFERGRIAALFQQEVEAVSSLDWGAKRPTPSEQ